MAHRKIDLIRTFANVDLLTSNFGVPLVSRNMSVITCPFAVKTDMYGSALDACIIREPKSNGMCCNWVVPLKIIILINTS